MSLDVEKLKEKYKDEKIYVIAKHIFDNYSDGLTVSENDHNIYGQFDNMGTYIYRYLAEGNPDYLQLIPYVLVKKKDEDKFFITKRLAGESRLINKISLGIGGHINECDGKENIIFKGLFRELNEEVNISDESYAINFIGYIKNSKSATNDHIGLAFMIEVNDCDVKETDNLEGEFVSLDVLKDLDKNNKLEDWAKYLLNYLLEEVND